MLTIVWLSCDHCVSCDCHVTIVWLLCDCHVTCVAHVPPYMAVMWWSCDAALGGHEDTVQSFSWHGDGSLLATICKVCTMHKNNGWCNKCRDHATTWNPGCGFAGQQREEITRVWPSGQQLQWGESTCTFTQRATAVSHLLVHTSTGGQSSQWTERLSCSLAGGQQLCAYSWI